MKQIFLGLSQHRKQAKIQGTAVTQLFTCGHISQRAPATRPVCRTDALPAHTRIRALARMLDDGPDPGLDVYIRFLVAYGLVFPLYVLVFIGPARPVPVGRSALFACGVAAILLMPAYEAGFIHGIGWPMAIPTLFVAIWLVTRRRTGGSTSNPRAVRIDPN